MEIKNSQKGQMIVEAILIMVVLLAIVGLTAQVFKKDDFVASLVSKPWQNIAGMLQNGVWAPPNKGAKLHPNHYIRHISIKGDSP